MYLSQINMSRRTEPYTIHDAKGATGAGNAIFCRDFRNVIFFFATDGGGDAALTVKFQGSIGAGISDSAKESAPNFGANASVTNMWDFIEVIDLESGSAINGDTGVAVATADDYRQFEANINGLDYINARITARTQGEVTVFVKLYND